MVTLTGGLSWWCLVGDSRPGAGKHIRSQDGDPFGLHGLAGNGHGFRVRPCIPAPSPHPGFGDRSNHPSDAATSRSSRDSPGIDEPLTLFGRGQIAAVIDQQIALLAESAWTAANLLRRSVELFDRSSVLLPIGSAPSLP